MIKKTQNIRHQAWAWGQPAPGAVHLVDNLGFKGFGSLFVCNDHEDPKFLFVILSHQTLEVGEFMNFLVILCLFNYDLLSDR